MTNDNESASRTPRPPIPQWSVPDDPTSNCLFTGAADDRETLMPRRKRSALASIRTTTKRSWGAAS